MRGVWSGGTKPPPYEENETVRNTPVGAIHESPASNGLQPRNNFRCGAAKEWGGWFGGRGKTSAFEMVFPSLQYERFETKMGLGAER